MATLGIQAPVPLLGLLFSMGTILFVSPSKELFPTHILGISNISIV